MTTTMTSQSKMANAEVVKPRTAAANLLVTLVPEDKLTSHDGRLQMPVQ